MMPPDVLRASFEGAGHEEGRDMPNGDRYELTISRQTVDKLGVKLYDTVSAVVAELVANSYDADATCPDYDIRSESAPSTESSRTVSASSEVGLDGCRVEELPAG
jgi:hypothetical protein